MQRYYKVVDVYEKIIKNEATLVQVSHNCEDMWATLY